MTDLELRKLAEGLLTAAQLQAFTLALTGMSERHVALALGISRRSVRDRLDAATAKLLRAGVRSKDGRWEVESAADPGEIQPGPAEAGGPGEGREDRQ